MLVVSINDHSSQDMSIFRTLEKINSLNPVIVTWDENVKEEIKKINAKIILGKSFKYFSNIKIVFSILYYIRTFKPSVVLFTTMQIGLINLLLGLLLPKNIKYIYFCHNIDYWYYGKDKSVLKEMSASRDTIILSRRAKLGYKLLFRKMAGVIVNTYYLKKKAEELLRLPAAVIPYRLSEEKLLEIRKKEVVKNKIPVFTIPGSVTNKRKNYTKILEDFALIKDIDFKLILLGKVLDKEITEIGKIKLGKKLISFDSYVKEDEFLKILLKTNFIILNLSEGLPYGKYKSSAVEADGPALGIPLIVKRGGYNIFEYGIKISFEEERFIDRIKKICNDFFSGLYEEDYLLPALEESKKIKAEKYSEEFKVFLNNI